VRYRSFYFTLKKLLNQIDLREPSYIEPARSIKELEAAGTGIVEAARGSLIHTLKIEKNRIKEYHIITPTQWNLGNGTIIEPGVAQKGMIGLENIDLAKKVFKSFDVCSVCTTH
jgi:hydrogenase large subunit